MMAVSSVSLRSGRPPLGGITSPVWFVWVVQVKPGADRRQCRCGVAVDDFGLQEGRPQIGHPVCARAMTDGAHFGIEFGPVFGCR